MSKKAHKKIREESKMWAVRNGEKTILPSTEKSESGMPQAMKTGREMRVTNSWILIRSKKYWRKNAAVYLLMLLKTLDYPPFSIVP